MYRVQQTDMRRAVLFWVITFSYMLLIFLVSSRRSIDLPHIPAGFDKVLHLCAYMVLAFLFSLSLRQSGIRKYVFLLAILLTSVYGISDEIHQSFVPGRDPSFGDLLADAVGAFGGSLAASLASLWKK